MDDKAEKKSLSNLVFSVEYKTAKTTLDTTSNTEMRTEDFHSISNYNEYKVKMENVNENYNEDSHNLQSEENEIQNFCESVKQEQMMLLKNSPIKKEILEDFLQIKLQPIVLLTKMKIENYESCKEINKQLEEYTQKKIKEELSENYSDVQESSLINECIKDIHLNVHSSNLSDEERKSGNNVTKIPSLTKGAQSTNGKRINMNNKSVQKYKCNICNKSVTRMSSLKHHMGLHVEESEFKCSQCGRRFGSEKTLVRHKLFHRKKHKCKICGSYFAFKSQLITHSYCHIVEKQYKCNVCEKFLKSKHAIHNHVKIHETKKFQCKICEKYFSSKPHLIDHMIRHGGEKKFECSVCNKRFALKGGLTRHSASHEKIGKYECDECNQFYTLRSNLMRHLRRHSGEKIFKCAICIKCFTTRRSLFRHIKLVHNFGNVDMFICNICTKRFKEKRLLALHFRVHYPMEKKFQCEICKKCFLNKYELSTHINYHIGERNHRCTYCNKCFISNSNLHGHMRTHSGKQLTCNFCGKSYGENSYRAHLKIHLFSGET